MTPNTSEGLFGGRNHVGVAHPYEEGLATCSIPVVLASSPGSYLVPNASLLDSKHESLFFDSVGESAFWQCLYVAEDLRQVEAHSEGLYLAVL